MELLEPNEMLRRAHAIGTYHGFRSLASFGKGKQKGNAPLPDSLSLDTLDPFAREVVGFLKRVRDQGFSPLTRPLFLWHTNATEGRPAPKHIVFQFHALGASRAIADAVLMRAVRSLTSDITKTEAVVRVNSMGDKETRGRLARELTSFFRKRSAVLPPESLECAKKDVLAAAELLVGTEGEEGLPSPTDHLSEASRKHFESVLEYLESTDTPYELAPLLFSKAGVWHETCFEIRAGERVHAWGSRYSDLARHFFKGAPSSVGVVLKVSTESRSVIPPVKEKQGPRFVFVHIGDEAKRESMKMTDMLRRARIPMTQVLGIESLTEQMRLADEHNPRFLLIMGRKEALERSVILRERATHTETFIPFDSLVDQLKAVA
ncbi:MAG: His/Gly/Thr/Pro-type tRNA ligase C-terminal domain-containing protein [Minisyncoccia bacterium]